LSKRKRGVIVYAENFENKPSLLETDPQLKGYRFYRQVPTDKKIETKRKDKNGKPIKITVNQKEYYSIEDIEQLDLKQYSKVLPDMNGHKTIINNYFIRFWAPVLDPKQRSGGNIAFLYITLLSYCYGDRDYVWVSISTLAETINASEETVRKYLKILEEEGFIIRFWREKENEEEKTEQGSMLIKVRRSIPFLTKEKLEKLSPKKKAEHDRFLRSIKLESQFEFEEAYNYIHALEKFREKAVEVKVPEIEETSTTPFDIESVKHMFSKEEQLYWGMVLKRIEQKISKESYEQWFANTMASIQDDRWTIYCPHIFIKEHLEQRYTSFIQETIQELTFDCKQIRFTVFSNT
jgi:DNA-binding Lrp family transcriptional regulator